MVNDEEAINTCIGELNSAIQEAIAASAPKHQLHAEPPLPASILDEICRKNWLRR
jgi:hypothetical protein